MRRVAVIGATGSVGQVTVPTLRDAGLDPIAVVRDLDKASALFPSITVAQADVTDGPALASAVQGVDAVVLVHGSDNDPERVDYGAVPAVLEALDGARAHIVLMTSMAVTHHMGSWREIMHWKARGERLLRASGWPATIVRPGWFDLEEPGYGAVTLEQGDTTPVDSKRGVGRQHIADAIVQSLLHEQAVGCTFELFSAPGDKPGDWENAFGALAKDRPGELDAALDPRGPDLDQEPARLVRDLERWHLRVVE